VKVPSRRSPSFAWSTRRASRTSWQSIWQHSLKTVCRGPQPTCYGQRGNGRPAAVEPTWGTQRSGERVKVVAVLRARPRTDVRGRDRCRVIPRLGTLLDLFARPELERASLCGMAEPAEGTAGADATQTAVPWTTTNSTTSVILSTTWHPASLSGSRRLVLASSRRRGSGVQSEWSRPQLRELPKDGRFV